MSLFVGTAGWNIPRQLAEGFDSEGTALERYSSRFRAVEVNSSFHRPHKPSTWERWARLVPQDFRFAVKMPKTISHERKLVDCSETVGRFLEQAACLGPKLAVLLIQLPPRLAFDEAVARAFFELLSSLTDVKIVCEPRHPSWFADAPDAMLAHCRIARAATDPAPVPTAALPGGWRGLSYWRLHGSPVMYRSEYGDERLARYAVRLSEAQHQSSDIWCMFDNTASSAAASDALRLTANLTAKPDGRHLSRPPVAQ